MKKSMMKKLVILLVVMVVSGGFVFGATSDTLSMNGTVQNFASIAFTDPSVTFNIDPLTGFDASATTDALTTAVAVANTGYTVTVSESTVLTGQTDGETISYTVYLDGVAGSYTGTVTDGNAIPFGIKIDQAPADEPYLADTYAGTVTLAISNN